MRMFTLAALTLLSLPASAEWVPDHDIVARGHIVSPGAYAVGWDPTDTIGGVEVTDTQESWDWSGGAFPAEGFVVVVDATAPVSAAATPYANGDFDSLVTDTIGNSPVFEVFPCGQPGYCGSPVMYLEVIGGGASLRWYRADGETAARYAFDTLDAWAFLPAQSVPTGALPVIVQ